MSDDNQNEFKLWGDKLNQLESLPGDPMFRKEEAWEKLNDRINKKQKKSVPWYWIAAAIVILSAGLWLMDPPSTDKGNVPVTKLDLKPVDKYDNPQMAAKTIVLMQKQDEEAPIPRKNKQFKRKIPATQNAIQLKDPVAEIALIEEAEKPINPMESIQETTGNINIARAPIKKLKVIHINELNVKSTEGFAGKRYKSDQAIPRLNETTPSLSLSRNTSDNILKLKISPSN